MKQYNIYAGLGGSFGGAQYQFTGLYENEDEAVEDAFQAACEDYDQYVGTHGLPGWEDAVEAYCNDQGIDLEDFDEDDDEVLQEAEEYYSEARESWIEYWAVPTDEDSIDQNDLILGYILEDDSTSQADSE